MIGEDPCTKKNGVAFKVVTGSKKKLDEGDMILITRKFKLLFNKSLSGRRDQATNQRGLDTICFKCKRRDKIKLAASYKQK